jgi:para-nitrobenzyl esterase
MIAETTAGRVPGTAVGLVTAYLGVPYADADRFAVPRPVRALAGVRDASAPPHRSRPPAWNA